MTEYAPGITGTVHFSRQERAYFVELFDARGTFLEKTGFYPSEAKAREAGRKLAAKHAGG
jgi:hypothetical protein